eukprot:353377-Prorocentrum_minimum.AAC.6
MNGVPPCQSQQEGGEGGQSWAAGVRPTPPPAGVAASSPTRSLPSAAPSDSCESAVRHLARTRWAALPGVAPPQSPSAGGGGSAAGGARCDTIYNVR